MSFSEAAKEVLANLFQGFPIVVCTRCVWPSDAQVGAAGDFGVCERCRASVTSKTGVTVRQRKL